MNTKDIKIGKTYTDGKGGQRQVIGEGPELKHYSHSVIADNIRIKVIKRSSHDTSSMKVGDERNIPRASFANWAKSVV